MKIFVSGETVWVWKGSQQTCGFSTEIYFSAVQESSKLHKHGFMGFRENLHTPKASWENKRETQKSLERVDNTSAACCLRRSALHTGSHHLCSPRPPPPPPPLPLPLPPPLPPPLKFPPPLKLEFRCCPRPDMAFRDWNRYPNGSTRCFPLRDQQMPMPRPKPKPLLLLKPNEAKEEKRDIYLCNKGLIDWLIYF